MLSRQPETRRAAHFDGKVHLGLAGLVFGRHVDALGHGDREHDDDPVEDTDHEEGQRQHRQTTTATTTKIQSKHIHTYTHQIVNTQGLPITWSSGRAQKQWHHYHYHHHTYQVHTERRRRRKEGGGGGGVYGQLKIFFTKNNFSPNAIFGFG
jgi:hypothetical protein